MSKAAKSDELLKDITKMMTDPNAASDDKKITNVMERIRDLDPKKATDEFMTMYHTRKAMTIGMHDQQQGGGGGGMPPAPPMDPFGMGGPPTGAPSLGGPPGSGGAAGGGATGSPNDLVNYEAVEKFKEDQRKDMLLGWKLLDIRGGNSQTARTARVLRIEVAQRLEDSEKLKEAFDDLMKRNLTEEEVMVAFTAAPFLGDWKSMMKLGRRIEKMAGGLEQLHMMSLQLPIPDFTVVYDLAKQHALEKRKAPKPSTLPWDLLNVSKIRVKFKDVNCGQFEEKRDELLKEIQKQGDIEWEDVPTVSHVHVKRMGALCQAVSFGEIPMMLNGPWLEGRIHVKGRAEMPLMPEDANAAMMGPYGMPSMDQMTILIQEEEWDLKRQDNNNNKDKNNDKNKDKNDKNDWNNDDDGVIIYSGKYTLNQRPQLPPNKKITPEHAPVNMEFECQVFLTMSNENDKNNNKNSKNKNKNKKNKNNQSNNSNNNNNNTDDTPNGSNNDEKVDDDPVDPIVTEFDGLELD